MISEPTSSRSAQTVQNIKQLQEAELQAFQELENKTGTTTLTTTQKSALIDKINNLTVTRENLYSTLRENRDYYNQNLTSAKHTLVQQTDALEVVELELNRTKRRVDLLNDERIRRLRLVEINRYYGDKYKHHTSILKNITLMFAILLVIVMINNTGKLPQTAFKTLIILVLAIGMYVISRDLYDAYNRDNMVYDQYNWSKMSPDWQHPTTFSEKTLWGDLEDELGICENQGCCPADYTWVPPPFNKCLANSELSSKQVETAFGKAITPYDPKTSGADGIFSAAASPAVPVNPM